MQLHFRRCTSGYTVCFKGVSGYDVESGITVLLCISGYFLSRVFKCEKNDNIRSNNQSINTRTQRKILEYQILCSVYKVRFVIQIEFTWDMNVFKWSNLWQVFPPAHQNLPESNPLRMEETRQRNALVMQALKDAAETSENLARGLGPSK